MTEKLNEIMSKLNQDLDLAIFSDIYTSRKEADAKASILINLGLLSSAEYSEMIETRLTLKKAREMERGDRYQYQWLCLRDYDKLVKKVVGELLRVWRYSWSELYRELGTAETIRYDIKRYLETSAVEFPSNAYKWAIIERIFNKYEKELLGLSLAEAHYKEKLAKRAKKAVK